MSRRPAPTGLQSVGQTTRCQPAAGQTCPAQHTRGRRGASQRRGGRPARHRAAREEAPRPGPAGCELPTR
eukprot:10958462-Alexandrium_andersonii.AAC.1